MACRTMKALVVPVLCHRLVLGPAAEIEGRRLEAVLANILNRVDPPR